MPTLLKLESLALFLLGIFLFAHSAFDRIFGYGLKYADAFQHTHLGWIGKRTPMESSHD